MQAGFLNANLLETHIRKIHQFQKYDPFYYLFEIMKSKLGPVVEDYLVQIDGYTQDRKLGGGGVALHEQNSLKVKILEKADTTKTGKFNKPEYLMCSVQWGSSSPLFFAVVYR